MDLKSTLSKGDNVLHKTSSPKKCYRLWVCFVYAIAQVFTGFLSSPLAPIADAASKAYNINISTVNLATSLFSFACLITGIPANILIIKLGLRKSKILANLIFVAGSILKLFVNKNIYFVLAGQLLAGLGTPFV